MNALSQTQGRQDMKLPEMCIATLRAVAEERATALYGVPTITPALSRL